MAVAAVAAFQPAKQEHSDDDDDETVTEAPLVGGAAVGAAVQFEGACGEARRGP